MPRKVKNMSISSTAQALLDQAAHVFGNPTESERIASSEMPQPPPIHLVKRGRKKAPSGSENQTKTITNRDLSVEFSPETMAALPKRSHKKKVKAPPSANQESPLNVLADAAMAQVAGEVEANRTAPTHPETIIPSPPRTGATATRQRARKKAVLPVVSYPMDEVAMSNEVALYEPNQSNQVALYNPEPQPDILKTMPDKVMPYMSDNVNLESVQAALKPSNKVRAPRKTGGSLRALANRASFAAQVATHSALM